MTSKTFKILLVEDDPEDVLLTQEVLNESGKPIELTVVYDGSEALHYLITQSKQGLDELPHLVLLDINLPKISGHEILVSAKHHPDLKHIPIVMLSTSNAEDDFLKAYEGHATHYLVKPLEIAKFLNVASKIEEMWLNPTKHPKN